MKKKQNNYISHEHSKPADCYTKKNKIPYHDIFYEKLSKNRN